VDQKTFSLKFAHPNNSSWYKTLLNTKAIVKYVLFITHQ
jgi:hypothetical protein